MTTWRGIEEGLPRLLNLLADVSVGATVFSTGESARRYPAIVQDMVAAGHELGCHGDQHRSFARLDTGAAQAEIERASEILRMFYPVRAFRAPYLKFPAAYLPILARADYRVDSSVAKYKSYEACVERVGPITRVPVSITSSLLRWPRRLREEILARLSDPV